MANEITDEERENAVTLLAMTVPLPGAEDEAKQRWVALLKLLGTGDETRMVLRQKELWPAAHEAIRNGHTVQIAQEHIDRAGD